jgi:hypothetical protein
MIDLHSRIMDYDSRNPSRFPFQPAGLDAYVLQSLGRQGTIRLTRIYISITKTAQQTRPSAGLRPEGETDPDSRHSNASKRLLIRHHRIQNGHELAPIRPVSLRLTVAALLPPPTADSTTKPMFPPDRLLPNILFYRYNNASKALIKLLISRFVLYL